MKRVLSFASILMLLAGTVAFAPSAQAAPPKAWVVDKTASLAATPVATFRVSVPELIGSYALTWNAGDGVNGSSSGELTAEGVTSTIEVDPGELPDGSRQVTGTITVTDPLFGVYENIPYSFTLLIDRTVPQVTSVSSSSTAIYPRIASGGYPAALWIRADATDTGPVGNELRIYLRSASGQDFRPSVDWSSTGIAADWLGETENGVPMPYGAYRVVIKDSAGNAAITDLTLTKSTLHEEHRVWKRTVTPKRSLVDRYVGRCSVMKIPSARRSWTGSIGYYANTRCGVQTGRASAVQGIHAVRGVPKARRYSGLYIHGTGGAATSRPRSTALLGVIDTEGEIRGSTRMQPRVGAYRTRIVQRAVFPDQTIGWLVHTAFGERYDVKSFTVELHYFVLVA